MNQRKNNKSKNSLSQKKRYKNKKMNYCLNQKKKKNINKKAVYSLASYTTEILKSKSPKLFASLNKGCKNIG